MKLQQIEETFEAFCPFSFPNDSEPRLFDDELTRLKKEVLRKLERAHETPLLDSIEFDKTPLGASDNPDEQGLLNTIAELKLDFQVFLGEAKGRFWDERLKNKIPRTERVLKIRSEKFKMQTELGFIRDGDNKIAVHVLWFKVDKEFQGNFFRFKEFVMLHKKLLLKMLGYPLLYGCATFSTNSESRFATRPEDDFRFKKYTVCDSNGKPFRFPGIVLLYLRMGFCQNPLSPDEEMVFLFSDAKKAEMRKELGDKLVDGLLKFSKKKTGKTSIQVRGSL